MQIRSAPVSNMPEKEPAAWFVAQSAPRPTSLHPRRRLPLQWESASTPDHAVVGVTAPPSGVN
ncbi:MAG: hypothetical protein M0R80_30965, partial [Proteobacteria bacterium]|nr:hypothetical protein [Pseudomonadota bacterium]